MRTCLCALACPRGVHADAAIERIFVCLCLQHHWTRTRTPTAFEKRAGLLSAFPTRRHRQARSNVAGLSSVNTAAKCAAMTHAVSARFCVAGTPWCVGRQFAILTGFWPRKLPTNWRSSSTLPERTSPSPLLPSVSDTLPHCAHRCRLRFFAHMRVANTHTQKQKCQTQEANGERCR